MGFVKNINFSNYTFLITGGAGFIGSHIVGFLLRHNAAKVRAIDNLSNGSLKNIEPFLDNPQFEFIQGDIRDYEFCNKSCESIDFILHQAALGSVPRSVKDPITTNSVNVEGFLNILVAAKENKVKKVVYASSSSVYGDSKQLPKVEETTGNLLSPYAVSKYINELYAGVFWKNYGLSTIGLRYFNVFGPRQDPNGPYAAVIPLFFDAILGKKEAIIYGDGLQTRDFTYVDNVVQANIKAAFAMENADNKVYNIAVGERVSLNGLWQTMNEIAGVQIPMKYTENRLGDIRDSLANISKANELIGYEPKIKLREGLEKTYKFFIKEQ